MKRWHEEAGRTRRQWKIYEASLTGAPRCKIGHFRKRKAMDCGKSRCHLCHHEKIMGFSTRQEIRADIDLNEQLNDMHVSQ